MKHFNKFLFFFLLSVFLFFLGCQSQYMTAGKVYLQQKPANYDAAIEQFKKAIEAEPNNPETYIWLGKAYAGKKLFEEACKQTEKGLSIDPKRLGELKNDPSFDYWAVFYNAALVHIKNKEFELAIKRVKRSLDIEPKNAQSMNLLAFCYEELKNDDEAEKTYNTAMKLIPDNIDTYINLANFYKRRSKLKQEETVLKKAKKVVENPDWLKAENEDIAKRRKKAAAKVYIELGNVLLKDKKFDEAEGVLKKAITLTPEDKDVNFNYALALLELKKYAEAVGIFQKVVSKDSLDKEGYFYLGFAYLKMVKYNDAIEAFTRVIEIDPEYCEAYLDRAFAERELGNTAAAYEDAKVGTECKERAGEK